MKRLIPLLVILFGLVCILARRSALKPMISSGTATTAASGPSDVPADEARSDVSALQAPVTKPPVDGDGTFAIRSLPRVRETAEGIVASSRPLHALFAAGGVRFNSPRADHFLELRLDEILAGDRVLARGGDAIALRGDSAEEVRYERGSVIERYTVRDAGIEQDFFIPSAPGKGDLRVSCRVRSSLPTPADGTSARTLEFHREGPEAFTISDALAIDSAGRQLSLDLMFADGRVSMTVPESWVGSATFPITIDPLVGGVFTIDADGGGSPDVAYAATRNEWLVVWSETTTYPASSVFGQRVAQNGNLVGSPITIGSASLKNFSPRVSYAPDIDRYVVVWRYLNGDYVDSPPSTIRGRVLNGDGTPYTAEFPITSETAAEQPNVAYDGDRWFVCWRRVVYGNSPWPTYIRGQFVRKDGVLGNSADPDPTAVDKRYPRLTYGGGQYVIAWPEVAASPAWQLKARTMTPSGTFGAPVVVEPNLPQYGGGVLDASYCNGKVLFEWGTSAGELRGRIANPDLTFPAASFVVRSGTPGPQSPFAGATPVQWLSLYDGPNSNGNIQSNHITTTGSVASTQSITTNGGNNNSARASWSGQSSYFLIVFGHGTAAPFSIRGWRYDLDTPNLLEAPPNLVATPGNNQVSLSWGASSGATSYEIYRTNNPAIGYPTTPLTATTLRTYTDTATNGYTYWYMVKALNATKTSGISIQVSATPMPPPPPPPANVQTTAGPLSVTISWTASPGATSYIVKRGASSGGPFTTIASGLQATSFVDTDVTYPSTCYYVVQAVNVGGTSAATAAIAGSPAPPSPPPAPTNLLGAGSVMNTFTPLGQVQLAWEARLDDWAYNVKRSNIPGGPYTIVALRTPLRCFTDRGLALGLTYYYVVTALSGTGESATSNEVAIHVRYPLNKPQSESTISFTYDMNGRVRLFWTPVDGATTYEVWRTTDPQVPEQTFVVGSSMTQDELYLTDTNVGNGTKYWYSVKGRNIHGTYSGGMPPPVGAQGNAQAQVPDAPTAQLLSNANGNAVVTWSQKEPTTNYIEEISASPTGPWVQASGHYIEGQVATDSGMLVWLEGVHSLTYFSVRAANPSGTSGRSNVIALDVVDPGAPPPTPTNVLASHASGSIALSWNRVPQAVAYQIFRSTQGSGLQYLTFTYATVLQDGTVSNGQQYEYVVRATNIWGASGDSNLVWGNAWNSVAPPAAPVVTPDIVAGGVILSWTSVNGANGYIIRRSAISGGPYDRVGSVGAALTDFQDYVPSGTYYYRVYSVGDGGESPSAEVQGVVP